MCRSVSVLFRSVVLGGIIVSGGCGGGGDGAPSISMGSDGTTATLMWEPVNDSSVYEYRLYYGTQSYAQSQTYPNRVIVSTSTTTVPGLDPVRYYFAVTAFNGSESEFSPEVCYDFRVHSVC
jgi:hypothetical protein